MRVAVLQFPGSNCDRDVLVALHSFEGVSADLVWHQETSLKGFDAMILPGGFSYGDYLRCGAIARFSPVMKALRQVADEGKPILCICNGFQILCEAGFLPGTLVRNRSLLFRCEPVLLKVEGAPTPFTSKCAPGQILRLPIAHGEGCYVAPEKTLKVLEEHHQIIFRYCDTLGECTSGANPNGSLANIAGVCNRQRNVVGLMPHPERACEALLGGTDGRLIFESMIK